MAILSRIGLCSLLHQYFAKTCQDPSPERDLSGVRRSLRPLGGVKFICPDGMPHPEVAVALRRVLESPAPVF